MYLSLLCMLVLLLASCAEAPRTSQWGQVVTIASAEQTHAPALAADTDRFAAVWVGVNEGDIFPYIRTAYVEPDVTPLPLPPAYPHDHRLLTAANGGYHLFWRDALYSDPNGTTYLWTVYIDAHAQTERGQVQLSDAPTGDYTILANPGDTATVVYTLHTTDEPVLYIRDVDARGRPRPASLLVSDAHHPVLVRGADGVTLLYWIRASDERVMVGRLDGQTLVNSTPLMALPAMDSTAYLHSFHAGFDHESRYLLWNITRADGTDEVWIATTTDGAVWTAPARLGTGAVDGAAFETGFNGGAAQRTTSGADWLRYAVPLAGQFESLVIAAQVGDGLVLVYLRRGEVVALQTVITLEHDLIGTPALVTDRDRHLYLAWAEPANGEYANLNLTATKY